MSGRLTYFADTAPSWNSVFGTTWLRFSSRSRFRNRARNLVGPRPDDVTTFLSYLSLSRLSTYSKWTHDPGVGGTPYVIGDTYVPRFWPPFFTLAGSSTIFLGYFFSSTNTKTIFWGIKLPILTEFDILGPKFHFSLDLFGSNFQRPAAHPHHFLDQVPSLPPPPPPPPPAHDTVLIKPLLRQNDVVLT